MYACLHRPPAGEQPTVPAVTLAEIAREFSPRFEWHGPDLISIDVSGLERLIGPPEAIGDELKREITARGMRAHVAVAATRTAALVLAIARPGVTIVARGAEAAALAPIHIGILEKLAAGEEPQSPQSTPHLFVQQTPAFAASSAVSVFKRWGLRTLGELAALPAADLASRMGKHALAWQALACGEDTRPLIPALDEERFDATLELDWPIEELEPLSFVLTRLLEPLSTRLERRDRGAAVLHVLLRLVTREVYTRRLELPTPMRDVRTLRTLALLDLETHPPAAGIDRVTIVIDPTPGRVLQHTLFTRAHPTPEQLSTLLARLGALMGQDRFGAPAAVDSYRPGAFAMAPFATDHHEECRNRRERGDRRETFVQEDAAGSGCSANSAVNPDSRLPTLESRLPNLDCRIPNPDSRIPIPDSRVASALRRCRYPVPARVAVADGRPVRVATDRRGFGGGAVTQCAGPWRTSGAWWECGSDRPMGLAGKGTTSSDQVPIGPALPSPRAHRSHTLGWDRDEWDVSLTDGAVYRVFRDRETDAWFIDAIVD